MLNFAYTFNTLDIPSVVGPYVTVVGGIAAALLAPLVVMEMINEQTQALLKPDHGAPQLIRILVITFIVMLTLLLLYKFLFLKIVAICEAIGFALYNADKWDSYVENLVKANQGQISMLQLNVSAFAAAFFSVILGIIDGVFMLVRFVILSVLYVIGPLAIVGGVCSFTRKYTWGWFKMVFMVSFWVVLFRALQGTLLALTAGAGGEKDSLAAPIVVGIVVVGFSMRIHHFLEALGSGFVSSIAAGVISTFSHHAGSAGKHGVSALNTSKDGYQAAKTGVNAIKNWVSSKIGGGQKTPENKDSGSLKENAKPKLR